ncbi:hypothetical protein Ddc_01657 [Ditylenchus destructor]|nr:hypothetical protein Ddc_01657 [Ditylenchus destructor]
MAIDISNSGIQIAIINKCIGHFLNFPLFVPHINKEAAMGGNGAMKPPINIKFILAKNDGNKGDDGTATQAIITSKHWSSRKVLTHSALIGLEWPEITGIP